MLLTLPTELIDKICRLSSRADCTRLASVSWSIHHISNRVLYWSVDLDEHNLLPFIRTLFLHDGPTLPTNPFLMIRRFHVTNRDLYFICKGNPLLSIALSRMENLRDLDLCISGHAGDVSYLFFSKSGLILRDHPSDIPVLRPLQDCDWYTSDPLPKLRSLTVTGNHMFLRLASKRAVEKIIISSMMKLSHVKLRKAVNQICGDKSKHNALQCFTFALVVHDPSDILTAISMCTHAFPKLVAIDIIVHNRCDPVEASHPLRIMHSTLINAPLTGDVFDGGERHRTRMDQADQRSTPE